MSVAAPIETGDLPWPLIGHGVVAVHHYGFADSTAVCSCGWAGRRRYLKAAAEQDAWVHSMHEKCTVSVPLVFPLSRTDFGNQDVLQH
jgi:hypothetical protein